MNNEEKILAMLQTMQTSMTAMQTEMKGITTRLDRLEAGQAEIKEALAGVKEAHEITRGALNHLLDWSDKVSDAMDFPLPKT